MAIQHEYDYTSAAMKRALPKARVGGPAHGLAAGPNASANYAIEGDGPVAVIELSELALP